MRLAPLALIAFAFGACGDDDSSPADTTADTGTADVADTAADTAVDTAADTSPAGPNWSCLPDPQRPAPTARQTASAMRCSGRRSALRRAACPTQWR